MRSILRHFSLPHRVSPAYLHSSSTAMKGSSNKDSNKMFGEVCFGRVVRNVERGIRYYSVILCSSVHTRSYLHVNVNCPFPASAPRSRRNFSRRIAYFRTRRKVNKTSNTILRSSFTRKKEHCLFYRLNILMYFFVRHTNVRSIVTSI